MMVIGVKHEIGFLVFQTRAHLMGQSGFDLILRLPVAFCSSHDGDVIGAKNIYDCVKESIKAMFEDYGRLKEGELRLNLHR